MIVSMSVGTRNAIQFLRSGVGGQRFKSPTAAIPSLRVAAFPVSSQLPELRSGIEVTELSNSHFRLEDGEFGRFSSAACDSGDQKENFNGPKAIAGNGHRPRNSEGQRPVPFQPGAMAPGTGSIDMLEG